MIRLINVARLSAVLPVAALANYDKLFFPVFGAKTNRKSCYSMFFLSVDMPEGKRMAEKCSELMLGLLMNVSEET